MAILDLFIPFKTVNALPFYDGTPSPQAQTCIVGCLASYF